MLHAIKIYGLPTCKQTARAVATLEAMGVGFDYFDLSLDRHAAAWVRWKNGDIQTPTIMVGMRVLANPSLRDLQAALGSEAA
ncbi:glutaredoxin family protein [Humisphaera borealis]|uniref:Glutaredoxin family protein n=1 Tax=Humisphaera borealis TaxID=2807512 RepID=A0A7M2WUY6_9BACT|nr:glutaredoxin family protein [Humisphaera borealis]QOV89348.1 glutaredoxin family protein [Humisphaera borealis]